MKLLALYYSIVAAHIFVNSDQFQTARHECNVSDRNLFMFSFCSGQSLVIGPTAVEFEVWLCDFASVAESVLPAPQKAHSHLPTL